MNRDNRWIIIAVCILIVCIEAALFFIAREKRPAAYKDEVRLCQQECQPSIGCQCGD